MGQVVWDIGEFFVWEDHRLVLDRSLLDSRAALDVVNVDLLMKNLNDLVWPPPETRVSLPHLLSDH